MMNDDTGDGALTGLEIAVIGMAGRFPGAENLDRFWENLVNGVESLVFLSDEELKAEGVAEENINHPSFVKTRGGIIERKEYFDASFFGYPPQEALVLSPQARILFKCAWEALENAGYNSFTGEHIIGLYAGASSSFDWKIAGLLNGKRETFGEFSFNLLTDEEHVCTRVSYRLNLQGPAVFVKSACSTSLLAIHLGCQALLNGECDISLAGGVHVKEKENGYLYQEGMVVSADGHCRAFDARGTGFAPGEGCGMVVLKPWQQALDDNDSIWAVIKGTAVNNDGSRKVGYTAPSVSGQEEVIKMAQQVAGVSPDSISYVETHGTATPLGDAVEVKALSRVFSSSKTGNCAIGSVKTNVGHLGMAAGIVGFIKTVLALKNQCIPPSLNFETPNPNIDFAHLPFYVNTRTRKWEGPAPLRAGVSSFGIGGTNVHVILEEAPEVKSTRGSVSSLPYYLLVLSANSENALEKVTENLVAYLSTHPQVDFPDVVYTLQVGRRALPFRKILVCSHRDEALQHLSTQGSPRVQSGRETSDNPPVIFMFSGLGSQYVDMGLELYQEEPWFRQEINRCFDILARLTGKNFKEVLYPSSGGSSLNHSWPGGAGLYDIDISQPVVFSFEYALAQLLVHWGIKPKGVIGYSFGEYTAACLAGVFSLEDALKLIVARCHLMKQIPGGAMLSIPLPASEVATFLSADLSLCIDNGPSCIVGGTETVIAAFEKEMKQRRLLTMRVPGASHAVHSHMMTPILEKFEGAVSKIKLMEPTIPCISNVTGGWLKPGDAINPRYWARHLGQTVRFADGVRELIKNPDSTWIEVGPGRDLTALVSRHLEEHGFQPGQKIINVVKPEGKDITDLDYFLNRVGRLWLNGVKIKWANLYREEKRGRIPLPTYPFEEQLYWLPRENEMNTFRPGWTNRQNLTLADRFYLPTWKQVLAAPPLQLDVKPTVYGLIFMDSCGLGERLLKRLNQDGHQISTVIKGDKFQPLSAGQYAINPGHLDDYLSLFREWSAGLPTDLTGSCRVVHLWNISGDDQPAWDSWQRCFDNNLETGFYSLIYIASAIRESGAGHEFIFDVVTDYLYDITGEEETIPYKATMIGPLRVIPQEYPNIRCRCMDIKWPCKQEILQDCLVEQVTREISGNIIEPIVVLRGRHIWVQSFEPLHLENGDIETVMERLALRQGGVYLITGGAGEIGLSIAEFLVKHVKARLILTRRSPLPPRDKWEGKLARILELEAIGNGSEILVKSCDVADEIEMANLIKEIEARWGSIHGVIHAAGVVDMNTFQLLGEINHEQCENHFRAKVGGTVVLANLFKGKKLDFVWLMSSLSVVLGGLRFTAYAGANAFLDAFMKQWQQYSGSRCICVDWEGMPANETIDAFKRILACPGLGRVIVTNDGNLHARFDQWVKLGHLDQPAEPQTRGKTLAFSRPQLLNPFIGPQNQTQSTLAEIWCELFGYEQVGIHDDFMELGGDSLKAITVIARIHKRMNVEISLSYFFSHPSIEPLANYIDSSEETSFISIEPVEKKEYYRLASAQKRLFTIHQLNKESTSYNVLQVEVMKGAIDLDKFKTALNRLIARHESMRTSLAMVDGEPVQFIADEVDFSVDYRDFSIEPISDAYLSTQVSQFIKPFDLSLAPLMRLGLFKIQAEEYILIVDMHHIISDGVSVDLMIRDFMSFYRGETLESLPIQYKDFAEWQQGEINKKALIRQQDYWLERFQGKLPVLDMPTDFLRPPLLGLAGEDIRFFLDESLTASLRKLAESNGATLYIVLLTVFNILLSKYSGQSDIIIGTPVAGRHHADLDNIIGFFINVLPMRNFPQPRKSVQEFLQEVKTNSLQAFENQDYPFDVLVEQLNLERDSSRNPLYDVVFTVMTQGKLIEPFNSSPSMGEEADAMLFRPYEGISDKTSKTDLRIGASEIGDIIDCLLTYSTSLFERSTAERMSKRFIEVARQVATNPGALIKDIMISDDIVTAQVSAVRQEEDEFDF